MKSISEQKENLRSSTDNKRISKDIRLRNQDHETKWLPKRGNHYVIIEW